MDFEKRFGSLNKAQREAVEQIDGPLLVVAGPGTGKTELLSMRTAQILKTTDTLPQSILCLTFTESGAMAMRKRLTEIIGADAYKVNIQTFHGFGSDIITRFPEYFYNGAAMEPADDITRYEIMRSIFDTLDYHNPLAGKNFDEYTYLKATIAAISDIKRSGLTSEELRAILDDDSRTIDSVEDDIADVFADKISKSTAEKLAPIAAKIAGLTERKLPAAITPYLKVLSLSLAHAIEAAVNEHPTKPITAWKKAWLEKNDRGELVFKDRKSIERLRAVADIYDEYLKQMAVSELYDYDDMILQVISAMESSPALAANLRENYLYIMVDEFQDTNLAQLRILFNLTADSDAPNIMAVGDDDQGIFSFQGADVSNIHRFREQYHDTRIIVLTDNYRSTAPILATSRGVIVQADGRLESTIEGLSKELTSHAAGNAIPQLTAYQSPQNEYDQVSQKIAALLKSGVAPNEIAVIANRHQKLVELVPYLTEQNIDINYERRENVFELPVVKLLEQLSAAIVHIHSGEQQDADALIAEIICHPAFAFKPVDVWKLGINAKNNHRGWLETMLDTPVFQPCALWLINLAGRVNDDNLEVLLDEIIGVHGPATSEDYASPLYKYFFADNIRAENPELYLDTLDALRTIRDAVREHVTGEKPTLFSFLEFVASHHELGANLVSVRHRREANVNAINLLSAHKSKGLEFDHVFVIGLADNVWGERVASRSNLINYPANLPIGVPGASYDERIRLAYVAMTRARKALELSYYLSDQAGKETQIAGFISDLSAENGAPSDDETQLRELEISWRNRVSSPVTTAMRDLLASTLENYKLSATHLSNFLDVTKGGPEYFLVNNLLRFPTAKSASADYGTAIHQTLQQAHSHITAHGVPQPIEDIISNFENHLRDKYLTDHDFEVYLARGIAALNVFFAAHYDSFGPNQKTELGFGGQEVVVDTARLTGSLDLVDIDDKAKTIRVTDYKTGKPSRDWKGKSEYEKIKLHKYHQQLMFYQLLIENSRDYSKYTFDGGILQFVEPTSGGDIIALENTYSDRELADFKRLIDAVWQRIMTLDLPDTSGYTPTLKGILQFEADLVDNTKDI